MATTRQTIETTTCDICQRKIDREREGVWWFRVGSIEPAGMGASAPERELCVTCVQPILSLFEPEITA